MHYEVITRLSEGEARATPLLFVHGAWHGAWCWDEHFLPYFAAQGYQATALSLRGHGASWGSPRWARIEDYVADVALTARNLPSPPVIIGHSMGGFIVQKYLERFPAQAAVLMAPAPPMGALRTVLATIRRQPVDTVRALLTLDLKAFVDTPAKARYHLFSSALSEEQLAIYSGRIGSESVLMLLDLIGLELPSPARITTPMLVLGAAHDAVFTVEEVQATARAYNAESYILPGIGHDMMLEPGWQSAADTLLTWLRAQGH